MASVTDRLELLITATAKGAVRELNRTADATDNLGKKQSFLTKSLDSVGDSMSIANGGMVKGAAIAGTAAAATVKFAIDSANAYADLGTQVLNFQRVTGASADESSRWVAALDDLGISADKGSAGAFKLSREIASGGDKLKEFGVEVAKNKDGTADLTGTLLNIADAYTKTSDPVEKNALAMAAFGKAGKDLIPVLEQGRKGLEGMFKDVPRGQLFDQSSLENVRAYKLALDNLHDSLADVGLQVGGAIAPAMTTFANTTGNALTSVDRLLGPIGGLGGAFKAGATGLLDFGLSMGGVIPGVPLLRKGIGELADAFGIGGDASTTFADKQNAVKEAVTKVLDLQAAGKRGTDEYAAAVRAAKDASDELGKSTTQVGAAFESTAQKEFAATQQHLALASAGITLQQAALNVKGALDDEAKAQQDASDAAQFGIDQSDQVQAAHLKTEAAIVGVIDAAQKRAVQALGPQASSEEKARAATQATADAITFLAATTPGATAAIADLGYKVVTLPDGKVIVVDANTGQAITDLNALNEKADVATRNRILNIQIMQGGFDPSGSSMSGGIVQGPRNRARPLWVHGGEQIIPAGRVSTARPSFMGPLPAGSGGGGGTVMNVTVNVTAGGLGADAPEIQRAVVFALRTYASRNGPIDGIVRAN